MTDQREAATRAAERAATVHLGAGRILTDKEWRVAVRDIILEEFAGVKPEPKTIMVLPTETDRRQARLDLFAAAALTGYNAKYGIAASSVNKAEASAADATLVLAALDKEQGT